MIVRKITNESNFRECTPAESEQISVISATLYDQQSVKY